MKNALNHPDTPDLWYGTIACVGQALKKGAITGNLKPQPRLCSRDYNK